MKLAKEIPVFHPDQRQTLVVVPAEVAKVIGELDLAEFWETGTHTMRLRFVDPKAPTYAKQFKPVRHHGSIQVSVPRPWLHDKSAKPGDVIEVYRDEDDPKTLYLKYRPAPTPKTK